ncbi:MAG: hypothetical protein PHP52_03220 [Bacteroidales bacterium]|nr:hypothetical protein [Bacteroidales bacterium]MDD4216966.1 hypothetical protein [Bacteroidales bacterium]MDY0142241.1 hypothetical protein [Bacteroidales bacterium]
MENYYKTKSIFRLIAKWKWHLIVIMVVAGIFASVFSASWFIKPKFKSSAVIYPANLIVLSEESETEQMLEMIQSTDIKFQIINCFKLDEHYKINKDAPNFRAKILKNFDANVSFQKTPNQAVVITVVDTDPQKASDMADSIISFYNKMVLELHINKSHEILKIYKGEYVKRNLEIDSLSLILKSYRTEYGLLDLTAQVEKYTEAIYLGKSLVEARTVLGNWEKYGAEYQKTDSLYYYAISDMHKAKYIFESAQRDTEKTITYTHVVSKPFPADKKSYPIRWLIFMFSVVGAFLAGVIVISLIEGNKKQ